MAKHIFISLVLLFLSLLFVDEGKTIMLIADNIQFHLHHHKELEIPHKHNFNRSVEVEKWISPDHFRLTLTFEKFVQVQFSSEKRTEDYTGLIWQPPKSV